MSLSPAKQKFVDCASTKFGVGAILTRAQIDEIQEEFNASISGIGANVDAVSQTIQLKGTITNASSSLLPGMSGRVVF